MRWDKGKSSLPWMLAGWISAPVSGQWRWRIASCLVPLAREGNANRLAVKYAVFLLVNPNKGGALGQLFQMLSTDIGTG